MLVRGTHFNATLPSDWAEDSRGTTPPGDLRFVDPAYREIIFTIRRFEPTREETVDKALFDLARHTADVARQNGATFVSEPRVEILGTTRVGQPQSS